MISQCFRYQFNNHLDIDSASSFAAAANPPRIKILLLRWKEMLDASDLHASRKLGPVEIFSLKSFDHDLSQLQLLNCITNCSGLLHNVVIFDIKKELSIASHWSLDMIVLAKLLCKMPRLKELYLGPKCGSHDFCILPPNALPDLEFLLASDPNFVRLILTVPGCPLEVVLAAPSVETMLFNHSEPPAIRRSVSRLTISLSSWPERPDKYDSDIGTVARRTESLSDFFQSLGARTTNVLHLQGSGATDFWKDYSSRMSNTTAGAPTPKQFWIFGECFRDTVI